MNKYKILTGIQANGLPHIGNIFGSIIPFINYCNKYYYKLKYSFILIADLHAMTNIDNFKNIKKNVYKIISTYLSFGLNIKKSFIFRQSDIPETTELLWYFSCIFPYNRLKLAHSFKEKKKKIKKINVGLFIYPILMASDILLYNVNKVFIGKDQLQHIEISRKIASIFNYKIKNIFEIPEGKTKEYYMSIPGTDGKKMSKSRNNIIDIFSSNEKIKKQIMSIKTDNKLIKEKKDPKNDNIFSLYKLFAEKKKIQKIKRIYLSGNFSYLDIKKKLYKEIIEKFSLERKKFKYYMNNINFLEKTLLDNAKYVRKITKKTIKNVRKSLLFK